MQTAAPAEPHEEEQEAEGSEQHAHVVKLFDELPLPRCIVLHRKARWPVEEVPTRGA